tara:strand:+ start:544 stop:693 length:150 start_codon:yes stop_codon:yes gene_type:complete
MDLEHGLLLFFIGIPFSVLVLWGLIHFIDATEKQNKEDEDETTNDIYKL